MQDQETAHRATLGVSVVICCHNSACRLPQTLAHLAAQQVAAGVPWEVIVIDNASTDGTADVASQCWPSDAGARLRVVLEPVLGLNHARRRGIAESQYELISFVDDDNWVCAEWIQTVSDLMSKHEAAGACGGHSEAVCEVTAPAWFEQCNILLAVSPGSWQTGDVTETRTLWGAGLTIRRAALDQLQRNGFEPLLVGRQGRMLNAGEDTELCLALRLAGWRLWYERGLRLKHFMPAGRLDWRYLRRIYRGSGMSSVGCDPYWVSLSQHAPDDFSLRLPWAAQMLSVLKALFRQLGPVLRGLFSSCEGDLAVLHAEMSVGRLQALIGCRNIYTSRIRRIEQSKWRRPAAVVS